MIPAIHAGIWKGSPVCQSFEVVWVSANLIQKGIFDMTVQEIKQGPGSLKRVSVSSVIKKFHF
jgi:hypothetical protein